MANYYKDPSFINKQQMKLNKVIISEAPRLEHIKLSVDDLLEAIVEVRQNGVVVYKRMAKQFGMGEIAHFDMRGENVVLSDDCLFRVKYVYQGKVYPVFRVQMNTNFIFNNFMRVQMQ